MIPLKVAIGVLVLLLGLVLAAGLAVGSSGRPGTGAVREIIAAMPETFPPHYVTTGDGRPAGMAVDMFDDIAQRANLSVSYLILPTWADVQQAMKEGRVDVIPNQGISDQRTAYCGFTKPLEQFDIVLFRLADSSRLAGATGIPSGTVVGTLGTNIAVSILSKRSDIVLHTDSSPESLLDALLVGEVDVLALPEPVVWKLAAQVRVTDRLRVFGPPLATVQRAIAVRKGDAALLQRLNRAVEEYVGSTAHEAVVRKWNGGVDASSGLGRLAWVVAGAVVVLLVLFSAWKARARSVPLRTFFLGADGRESERRLIRRGVILTLIMVLSISAAGGSTLVLLYRVAFEKQRERLMEMVQSQARLMEAVARFDAVHSTEYPGGAKAASLQQITSGLSHFRGVGEFTLGRREGDAIVFLLRQRAWDRYQPSPIAFDSGLAEPMREALSGHAGTLIGRDYRGVQVLAAFEPVPILNLGVVAKVDIAEIRAPFIDAAVTSGAVGLVIVALGVSGFFAVGNPLVRQMVERERWFGAIVQQAGVGIALIDSASGTHVNANARYCEIAGLDADTLYRTSLESLLSPVGTDAAEQAGGQATDPLAPVRQGTVDVVTVEGRCWRRDGKGGWVKLTACAADKTDGEPGYIIAVLDDITERRQAEEIVNRFFEQPLTLHLIAGLDGTILRANRGWERALARPSASLEGRPFFELVHPDDLESTREEMARLARGDVTFYFENRYRHANGAYRWVAWSALASVEDGRVYAVGADITDRKRTEESLKQSEDRFQWFLSEVDDVVWLSDASQLEFISDACERIYGLPKDVFFRDSEAWRKAIHPEDREAVLAELMRVDNRGRLRQEYRIVRPDGTVRWLDDRKHFDRDDQGHILRMGGVATDVTDRKALEAALAEKTTVLERSNMDLQQFAYIASHDLREPLRMVGSFMQLLERNYGDRLDGTAREYIDFAVKGARRMDALIHDLLFYSRVQTHGQDFAVVDTEALVREALENLAPLLQDSGGTVDVAPLPPILADGPQIIQLFQNLIGNGLKYRAPDRPIVVRVSATVAGRLATVRVQDNGIGIEPQHSEVIFQIFQRLHAQEAYGGTGIGLAVCKRIVERHNGRIWVESEPGQGSTFCFTVPVAS